MRQRSSYIRNSASKSHYLLARDSDLEIINAQVLASGVIGRQTVPRAELWAGIMASDAAVGNPASRETLSDSAYFVNGFVSENVDKLQEGKNGDLWEHWMQEMSCDQHVVRKVKAHAEDDVLMGSMEITDYLANALADAAADAHAASQVNHLAGKELEKAQAMTHLVAR